MRTRIIAWADDDASEQAMVQAATADLGEAVRVLTVSSAQELLDLLTVEGEPDGPPPARPEIVFLSMQMNGGASGDVIRRIKFDPLLRRIPVIAYAPEDQSELFRAAYASGANACLAKPSTYENLRNVVMGSMEFWLNTARLPR